MSAPCQRSETSQQQAPVACVHGPTTQVPLAYRRRGGGPAPFSLRIGHAGLKVIASRPGAGQLDQTAGSDQSGRDSRHARGPPRRDSNSSLTSTRFADPDRGQGDHEGLRLHERPAGARPCSTARRASAPVHDGAELMECARPAGPRDGLAMQVHAVGGRRWFAGEPKREGDRAQSGNPSSIRRQFPE